MNGLVAVLIAAAAVDLPDYPQVSLMELCRAEEPVETPFVVLGTAARDGDQFALKQTSILCCSIHFSLQLNVELGELEPPDEGAWIAVYGRMGRAETEKRVRRGVVGRIFLDSNAMIEAELIVPAERLIKRANMVELLDSSSTTIFARAIKESGLREQLGALEPITVLAPVDHAFEQLGTTELETLFETESRDRLRRLVLNHVVGERLYEVDLRQVKKITTMTHTDLTVAVSNGTLRIADARTLFENSRASNGTLHLISKVLVPPDSPPEEKVDGP